MDQIVVTDYINIKELDIMLYLVGQHYLFYYGLIPIVESHSVHGRLADEAVDLRNRL